MLWAINLKRYKGNSYSVLNTHIYSWVRTNHDARTQHACSANIKSMLHTTNMHVNIVMSTTTNHRLSYGPACLRTPLYECLHQSMLEHPPISTSSVWSQAYSHRKSEVTSQHEGIFSCQKSTQKLHLQHQDQISHQWKESIFQMLNSCVATYTVHLEVVSKHWLLVFAHC